jgi:hypothetical protein
MWSDAWWLVIVIVIAVLITYLVSWIWYNIYEWTNQNYFVGIFAPINDSAWETMKIYLYPILLVTLVIYAFASRRLNNQAMALLLAVLTAVVFSWVIFYLYTLGDMSRSYSAANITIWVFAILFAFIVMYFVLLAKPWGMGSEYTAIALLVVIVLLWITWTYTPPGNCPFFTGKTGGNGGNGPLAPLVGGVEDVVGGVGDAVEGAAAGLGGFIGNVFGGGNARGDNHRYESTEAEESVSDFQ